MCVCVCVCVFVCVCVCVCVRERARERERERDPPYVFGEHVYLLLYHYAIDFFSPRVTLYVFCTLCNKVVMRIELLTASCKFPLLRWVLKACTCRGGGARSMR